MLFSLSANLHTIIDVNNFVVVKDLGTAILVSTKDTNPFPKILAGVSFLLFQMEFENDAAGEVFAAVEFYYGIDVVFPEAVFHA